MKLVELKQGSEEWLQFRKSRIGASDAATILGISPYCTPLKLWGEKLGLIPEKKNNFFMQRGVELEQTARDKFSEQMGMAYIPAIGVHDEYDWMMASFDGMAEDGTIVEIKCNGPKSHSIVETGIVPKHHMAQLQHQLYVKNVRLAFYYSFDGNEGLTIEVKRDDKYINNLIDKELAFYTCLESLTPPR